MYKSIEFAKSKQIEKVLIAVASLMSSLIV